MNIKLDLNILKNNEEFASNENNEKKIDIDVSKSSKDNLKCDLSNSGFKVDLENNKSDFDNKEKENDVKTISEKKISDVKEDFSYEERKKTQNILFKNYKLSYEAEKEFSKKNKKKSRKKISVIIFGLIGLTSVSFGFFMLYNFYIKSFLFNKSNSSIDNKKQEELVEINKKQDENHFGENKEEGLDLANEKKEYRFNNFEEYIFVKYLNKSK